MDFMKYHYCKLDKDHFSGVVGVKAHFESTDKRMGDGKKKERMSKTTLLKDFSGRGANKRGNSYRETQGNNKVL